MTECNSLIEVREHIDRLDRQIVPLLAERTRFVEQAARFKQTKQAVVDTDRIEAVVLKVRHLAIEEGMDPDMAEKIYRAIIDASIVHEAHKWVEIHES